MQMNAQSRQRFLARHFDLLMFGPSKSKLRKLLFTTPATLLFAGCVTTRTPQLVAIKQPGDIDLTCAQIAVEYKTNTEVALNKISKNRSDDTHDIIVGFFIWTGLADFQNADGNEGNALLDRNIYLREVAKDKNCKGMEFWPQQPERYTYGTWPQWSATA